MKTKTVTLEIRNIDDKVIIITKNGIENGTIQTRMLLIDNTVKYGIKTPSAGHNTHRISDQIFDTVPELLEYYQVKFIDDENND